MSSLQIGLAIAGGLVLGGVIAYNSWNARRNEPRQAQPDSRPAPLAGARAAPAGEADRIEPGLDTAAFADTAPLAAEEAPPDTAGAPLGPLPVPEKRPRLDALIDVIAPVALDGVVSGDALLAALPATRRVGSKPFAVEAQNEHSGEWEFPVAGQRYQACQTGVQLANRTGALNDIEFSEFVMKTQAFADAVGGAPDFPDMLHEVARARELDHFASEHDAQLGFSLRARAAAWSTGFVHQQAARLGFVAGVIPGRMVLPSSEPGLPPVLGLAFDSQAALADDPAQAAVREVVLSLDVPQVHQNERPFERLSEIATALAERMDGVITDDAGRPLRPEALQSIGADLEHLYATLAAHDLAAGSAQARRLFS
ncbi:cell division protein FtsZ [Comamonadaceae bacterium OH2545_COT-014]|nr:cell division protein FtsZ [Comamonadaceae bacterium OH2545_COT-014]